MRLGYLQSDGFSPPSHTWREAGFVVTATPKDDPVFRDIEQRARPVLNKIVVSVLGGLGKNWSRYEGDAEETLEHQRNVALLADRIARKMGLSREEREDLHFAAMLHDIGKFALTPDRLFFKGPFSDDIRAEMKAHPLESRLLIECALCHKRAKKIGEIAEQHHEHMDGSGYPFGLSASQICLAAKILAVADVYDALESQRCYKAAMKPQEAINIMQEGIGTHYDRAAFLALKSCVLGEKAEPTPLRPLPIAHTPMHRMVPTCAQPTGVY